MQSIAISSMSCMSTTPLLHLFTFEPDFATRTHTHTHTHTGWQSDVEPIPRWRRREGCSSLSRWWSCCEGCWTTAQCSRETSTGTSTCTSCSTSSTFTRRWGERKYISGGRYHCPMRMNVISLSPPFLSPSSLSLPSLPSFLPSLPPIQIHLPPSRPAQGQP